MRNEPFGSRLGRHRDRAIARASVASVRTGSVDLGQVAARTQPVA